MMALLEFLLQTVVESLPEIVLEWLFGDAERPAARSHKSLPPQVARNRAAYRNSLGVLVDQLERAMGEQLNPPRRRDVRVRGASIGELAMGSRRSGW